MTLVLKDVSRWHGFRLTFILHTSTVLLDLLFYGVIHFPFFQRFKAFSIKNIYHGEGEQKQLMHYVNE